MKHLKTGFVILGCLLSCCSFGKISLPSVIDNNMVLQQQSKVALMGNYGPPCESYHQHILE